MATKTVETWLKVLLIFVALVLIAFTIYEVLLLPENSIDDGKESGFINRFVRNRDKRAAEKDCLFVLIARESPKSLTSPDFPNNYPSNADCQWLLTTLDENATISIKFDRLAIEPEQECRLDYLQVYMGSNPLSPSLGPFCGNLNNLNNRLIETNSSTLLLVFHSDMTYEDTGFSIDYFVRKQEAVKTGCQELLTGGTSSLSSPKFPDNYPDNVDCSTLIKVKEGRKIILNFDSVDLEYGDNCTFDYVQIFDGSKKNSTLLGQICHQADSRSFESSSNSLLVHFHSDSSVNRKGYHARYSSVDTRHTPIGNCIWDSSEKNGTITSPNYPENYPSFSNCSIWILAPERHRIFVIFDALLMEMETNCSYDFLQIKEDGNILGKFCGRRSEPKQVVSDGHELQIQFQSDDFVEFLGFKLRYEFLKVEAEENNENMEAKEEEFLEEEAFMFSVKPRGATLPVGSPYYLHCSTEHPNAKIRWLKDNLFLAGDNPLPGLKVLANNTLWIQSMGHHLKGLYSCIAVSPEGTITATANIFTESNQEEMPCKLEFRKTPQDSEFEEGTFAHLECLATVPDARMSWTKDGNPLQQNSHFTVLKNGYIFMDNVRIEDAGLYTCVAQDPKTDCTKKVSAQLNVTKKTKIEDVCGKSKFEGRTKNTSHAKIVGGYDAQKGAYPWQVMLWERNRQSFCGATLLNERWIATAAHCILNKHNIPWERIRIKLGKHDRERIEDQEVETSIADSSAVVLHPLFNRFTLDNDIALIRMRHRISFTDYILPVCLGDRNLTESLLNGNGDDRPRMGTVIGWGELKESGALPRFLQEIKLPVVDPDVCKKSTTVTVTRNMFCAGYSQEVIGDACYGDSGGPFLMKHDGRWHLVGVVSWGEGCGKKYGFYTRIANHLSWIRGIMKS